ncbi:MAG TPA: hypothetical protein DCP31_09310, partial [Cyanobacteria bacterium UBA8543]|nr:hypothetical protein [Cyanobacteria bacterium UBA8543]
MNEQLTHSGKQKLKEASVKQYQNVAYLLKSKSMNSGKIRGFLLVFLLGSCSTAVLAGCNQTPTASNSPDILTSPDTSTPFGSATPPAFSTAPDIS